MQVRSRQVCSSQVSTYKTCHRQVPASQICLVQVHIRQIKVICAIGRDYFDQFAMYIPNFYLRHFYLYYNISVYVFYNHHNYFFFLFKRANGLKGFKKIYKNVPQYIFRTVIFANKKKLTNMAKTLSRKVHIYINGQEVEGSIKQLTDKIKQLEKVQKNLPIGTQEYIDKSLELRELRGILQEQKLAVKDLDGSWKSLTEKVANFSNIIMGFQSVMQMFDAGVGKLKDLAADAAALDDVYADVQKTTGLTHEEVEKLNEAFKKMDTRTSREQLNQLAYEAGKLGISSQEQVAQFVSASDKINIALGDVLGEGAMVTIGKLTEIFESSTKALEGKNLEEKMLAIGSAVNSLGQASTANEGYMVEFMKRLGGIASQAGLSADQILGYASALDQNGQAVEMSATAFTKMIMQMVKKPEEFVRAAGTSVEEFKRMMDEDMNGAILRVLEGMDRQGGFQEIVKMFNEMGLDGSRAAQSISSLAKHLDQVREAQALASDEIATGASVMNEYNTKNNTMQAQAEKAKKAFEDVRIELGNELYPVLVSMTKVGTGLTKGLAGFVKLLKENHVALAGVVALLARYAYLKGAAYLATGKLQKQLKSLLGIEKLEAMQKEIANAKQLKKIAADEKERLAEIKLELAKQKQIAAMKVEATDYGALTVKTMAQGRAQQLEAAATKQAEVATKANTAATNAQKAAFASTPWGLIITALTTIASLTVSIVTNSEKWQLHKKVKEAAREVGEAQYTIDQLFKSLRNAKVGSEEYQDALNKLKQEYPEIIKEHLNEKGALKDIEKAYKDVSKAARDSIFERIRAEQSKAAFGKAAEDTQDNLQGIQNLVKARSSNDEQAKRVIQQINGQIDKMVAGEIEFGKAAMNVKKILVSESKELSYISGNIISHMQAIATHYYQAQKTADLYETTFATDEKNPYVGKSKKELETSLAATQRAIDSLTKSLEKADAKQKKALESALQTNKKIKEQIEEAKKTATDKPTKTTTTTQGDGTETNLPSGKETPEQARARKAAEAWENFCNDYERLMAKIDTKTKTGIAKTLSEVDDGIAKMRQQLESKEVNHPDAAQKLADLVAAAERWKQSEIDKYIKKANEELAKFQAQHKGTSDIEAVNKVTEAYERLKNEIAKANEQINQYEQDLTDPNLSEEAKAQIQAIINGYRQGISDARVELIKTIDGSSVDVSGFTGSNEGKRQQLAAEYKKQSDAIAKSKESNEALLEILQKQLDTEQAKSEEQRDPAVVDALDAQIAALERQNTVLDENKKKLDNANESKEQLLDTEEWSTKFRKVTEILRNFADSAMETMQQLNDYLDNKSNRRIQDAEKERDAKIEALDEQLKNNIISDEQYTERKEAIEKEYNEKRKTEELEQFKRQKAMSLAQAHMSAALAVIQVWADSSLNTWAKIAMSAIAATNVALQTAAILAEPEPYAKGGYVPRETVFKAGEAGEEWVASNDLLTDPSTAPVIAALEKYQRGDTSLLQRLPFARVNTANVSAAAQAIDGRLSASRTAAQTDNSQMVALLQELCAYMKDPNNRRAVISRDYQMTYERNENFLRNMARL